MPRIVMHIASLQWQSTISTFSGPASVQTKQTLHCIRR
jgi:hypothetical protein